MLRPRIFYKGTVEYKHQDRSQWLGHKSKVVVEQISPRMGLIIESDGGAAYKMALNQQESSSQNRAYFNPQYSARAEIGRKVQLSRVICDIDDAAKNFEQLDKALKEHIQDRETIKRALQNVSKHPNFAGFKDA